MQMEKVNLIKTFLYTFGNNFKTKYEQLLEAYNRSQSVMILIKNVTTTLKGG